MSEIYYTRITCDPVPDYQNISTGSYSVKKFPFIPNMYKSGVVIDLIDFQAPIKSATKGVFLLTSRNLAPNFCTAGSEFSALAILIFDDLNVSIQHSFPGKFIPDTPNAQEIQFSLVNIEQPAAELPPTLNVPLTMLLKITC